jgi:hypothetical protein
MQNKKNNKKCTKNKKNKYQKQKEFFLNANSHFYATVVFWYNFDHNINNSLSKYLHL